MARKEVTPEKKAEYRENARIKRNERYNNDPEFRARKQKINREHKRVQRRRELQARPRTVHYEIGMVVRLLPRKRGGQAHVEVLRMDGSTVIAYAPTSRGNPAARQYRTREEWVELDDFVRLRFMRRHAGNMYVRRKSTVRASFLMTLPTDACAKLLDVHFQHLYKRPIHPDSSAIHIAPRGRAMSAERERALTATP